ncbi:MAG: DUF934 domain-containing protein, partial [Albidovulum sp.]
MSVIVRDDGFHAEDLDGMTFVEIASDTGLDALPTSFEGIAMIAITFPVFSDGRGFTLARHLRARGFAGRLRARGHIIADQYAMVRRSGFDEV